MRMYILIVCEDCEYVFPIYATVHSIALGLMIIEEKMHFIPSTVPGDKCLHFRPLKGVQGE